MRVGLLFVRLRPALRDDQELASRPATDEERAVLCPQELLDNLNRAYASAAELAIGANPTAECRVPTYAEPSGLTHLALVQQA
jgi:hypothetical protein